jgi:hypothetical protein
VTLVDSDGNSDSNCDRDIMACIFLRLSKLFGKKSSCVNLRYPKSESFKLFRSLSLNELSVRSHLLRLPFSVKSSRPSIEENVILTGVVSWVNLK